jgi:hypothetical protein
MVKQMKSLHIPMEKEKFLAFKTRCAENGELMSRVVKEGIDKYMQSHPRKPITKSLVD